MKFTTAAAALLPLASASVSATGMNARQATDMKFEISDFSAACTSERGYLTNSAWPPARTPDFQVSCDALSWSGDGKLPAVGQTQFGSYTVSVAQLDDGGLALTVKSVKEAVAGTYTVSKDDLKATTSGESAVQSYAGVSDFTIDVDSASSSAWTSSVSGITATADTPVA
ncbi:Uu.00g094980.m01.CDS01 [Anthostomella pinea]|uniref:Uu.00g094980.m01.CDS01 n=1 Tax=Anthostomella pinea TaxID=933095 RepID=A0AAI8YKR1_9PEZI|nr:Uu.00g094980.m01.CDS01 [Anthostomella pinea]